MDWDLIDWAALERLRTRFLQGTAGQSDYWQNDRELASYDQTFAQRIGWKWDYVLEELHRRGWTPPAGDLLDWGCGSGIASRAFLDYLGSDSVAGLHLWDRSPLAMQFARNRAVQKYPTLSVQVGNSKLASIGTLLISHVLTELTEHQTEEILIAARQATAVLWVESGTHQASRRLIAVREALHDSHQVVAPCPHQGRCGMEAPANAAHWCHHFAPPPAHVFTDSHWVRFAALAGIDLRSVPLSFLVLDQRPVRPLPAEAVRIIGRPRIYKPHATLLGCKLSGIHEQRLAKRALPEQFHNLKKGHFDPLQIWHCDQDEIVQARPALASEDAPVPKDPPLAREGSGVKPSSSAPEQDDRA